LRRRALIDKQAHRPDLDLRRAGGAVEPALWVVLEAVGLGFLRRAKGGGTHGIGIVGGGYTDDGQAGVAVAFDPKTLSFREALGLRALVKIWSTP
jgi:hypothetical protein